MSYGETVYDGSGQQLTFLALNNAKDWAFVCRREAWLRSNGTPEKAPKIEMRPVDDLYDENEIPWRAS